MTSRSYLLLILFLFAPGLVRGASVTAPYSIDFSTFPAGDTPIPNLTETTPDKWVITAAHKYRATADAFSAAAAERSAALNITNLFGRDFEISTRFTLVQFPTNIQQSFEPAVGLAAFSDSGSFAESSGSKYRVNMLLGSSGSGVAGFLNFSNNDTNGTYNAYSAPTMPISAGATYDLIFRGHAHDGLLDLTGTVSDGTNTISLFFSDNEPKTGKNFGLFASNSLSGTPLTVDFTRLTVVPEPTGAFLLLSMICLGWRRTNRKGRGNASPLN